MKFFEEEMVDEETDVGKRYARVNRPRCWSIVDSAEEWTWSSALCSYDCRTET